ncbi:MAG: flagellar assembly protein FliW [Thermodesulfobacteriota bacterium]|nr:flagellar assembly protein FliW [Thermodesulfobacteriota bacterium]
MAKRKTEKVIHTRIGKLPVDLERVIYFPRGLVGFEECKDFTLLQIRGDSPFLVLQSLTRPELGLLVADPFAFLADYDVKLGSAEQKILRLKNIRQVAVLVTVNIPSGQPERTALNLTGPILVNYEARIGLQVPQVDTKYPSRFYIHDQEQSEGSTQSSNVI